LTTIDESPIGAIELPLDCASMVDPDNLGAEAWSTGQPSNEHAKSLAELRLRYYDLVMDSLSVFEEKCSMESGSVSDAEVTRSHAYELAFASEDQMFHCALYTWLIQRGLADDLLAVQSFFWFVFQNH
jgi:nuclear pore complex protein Nup155